MSTRKTHLMQKVKRKIGCILLTAAVLIAGPSVKADDKGNPFEAYEKMSKPGPQHKLLASSVGSWTCTWKFWLKPGQEPQESKATAERKMVLDGRFLREDFVGEFLGKPFHGILLMGYDNGQGKYVGIWVDNMSTGIENLSQNMGKSDATGKVLTFELERFDPVVKAKIKSRQVVRILGEDKLAVEFFKSLPDGKEFKVMEIIYTRKTKAGEK